LVQARRETRPLCRHIIHLSAHEIDDRTSTARFSQHTIAVLGRDSSSDKKAFF